MLDKYYNDVSFTVDRTRLHKHAVNSVIKNRIKEVDHHTLDQFVVECNRWNLYKSSISKYLVSKLVGVPITQPPKTAGLMSSQHFHLENTCRRLKDKQV